MWVVHILKCFGNGDQSVEAIVLDEIDEAAKTTGKYFTRTKKVYIHLGILDIVC
jgi:hypothetical protein